MTPLPTLTTVHEYEVRRLSLTLPSANPRPSPYGWICVRCLPSGTGLWIVALIVVLILLAVGYSVMPLVIMCVAGVIIGLLLLVWEYFDRWDYRRLGQ